MLTFVNYGAVRLNKSVRFFVWLDRGVQNASEAYTSGVYPRRPVPADLQERKAWLRSSSVSAEPSGLGFSG